MPFFVRTGLNFKIIQMNFGRSKDGLATIVNPLDDRINIIAALRRTRSLEGIVNQLLNLALWARW